MIRDSYTQRQKRTCKPRASRSRTHAASILSGDSTIDNDIDAGVPVDATAEVRDAAPAIDRGTFDPDGVIGP